MTVINYVTRVIPSLQFYELNTSIHAMHLYNGFWLDNIGEFQGLPLREE